MVSFFTAVWCPSLPVWNELTIDSTEQHHGAVVNCSCDENSTSSWGTDHTQVYCDSYGNWLPGVPDCMGTFKKTGTRHIIWKQL